MTLNLAVETIAQARAQDLVDRSMTMQQQRTKKSFAIILLRTSEICKQLQNLTANLEDDAARLIVRLNEAENQVEPEVSLTLLASIPRCVLKLLPWFNVKMRLELSNTEPSA